MNRVVVTGVGVVSPLGVGRDAFWSKLTNGKSGVGPITLFDASEFPVRIGGQADDFDPGSVSAAFPQSTGVRDRKVFLGLAAAEEAVADAGLADGNLVDAVLSVGVGLETLCMEDLTPYANAADIGKAVLANVLADHGHRPLQTPLDRTGRILGERYGLLGGRYVNCSACAAGAQTIGQAFQILRDGEAVIALAGATDSMLNPLGLGGFSLLRVLSDENDQPQRACRPFDATRKGTVLGEGAAFVVLETADHAAARGARAYVEVLGYGSSMDALSVTDPDPSGQGAQQSMTRALAEAQLAGRDVDCVSAHGTGTPKNDAVETAAIKQVLGGRARQTPVHAVKSMTGHMIAASGSAEAVAAVLTITRNTVPPTINLESPDRECDLDYVPGKARAFVGRTVLSNSFGFGGQNATLIFGRYP